MKLFTLLLVCVLLALPGSADACSCREGSPDLHTNLRVAQGKAEAIFHARVLSVEPESKLDLLGFVAEPEAELEVLEVFKGSLGKKLVLPSGHGDRPCEFPFEAGDEYLVYAFSDEGRLQVSLCSRTRQVSKGDPELDWLRTGTLPPVPVALQREQVQCTPCEFDTVAPGLVGLPNGNECSTRLGAEDAEKALSEGRSFWQGGYYDYSAPSRTSAVGMSLDGRPFELVQTPHHGTEETCRQRVTRKWCERLEKAPPSDRHVPAFRCVNPGPEEELCNEETSRTASWGPREDIRAATCRWWTTDRPDCELAKESQPAGAEGAVPWLLTCKPAYDRPWAHACQVVPGSAGPGAEDPASKP
jgi:hypothetical protein